MGLDGPANGEAENNLYRAFKGGSSFDLAQCASRFMQKIDPINAAACQRMHQEQRRSFPLLVPSFS
jgi:hypothetical protein